MRVPGLFWLAPLYYESLGLQFLCPCDENLLTQNELMCGHDVILFVFFITYFSPGSLVGVRDANSLFYFKSTSRLARLSRV